MTTLARLLSGGVNRSEQIGGQAAAGTVLSIVNANCCGLDTLGTSQPETCPLVATGLNVVIQRELIGMWPKPNCIDFFAALVFHPRFDDILGEDVTLQQKLMVPL